MMLTLTAIVGFALVAMSIAAKAIGETHQIWENWRRSSTQGVSAIRYQLHGSSYLLWVIYGALKGDVWIMAAQGLGVVVCGVILAQMLTYRQNKVA